VSAGAGHIADSDDVARLELDDAAQIASLAVQWIFVIAISVWSSLDVLLFSDLAQAFAGEFEAVGVVDTTVHDGVRVGWVADNGAPATERQFRRDDGRPSFVAIFEDFQKTVPSGGIKGLQTPIIKDQEISADEARMALVVPRQSQSFEQPGHALIEEGAVITTGSEGDGL
jgi:hypothetical protein